MDNNDSIFAPHLAAFVSERVERLAVEAEKLPEYLEGKNDLLELRKAAEAMMDADDVEVLINTARGTDIPVYEYLYRAGLEDGIRITGMIDRLKRGE